MRRGDLFCPKIIKSGVHGQMIGGSGSHLVKCQRIGKKNKKKQKKKQQQHVSTRFQADDGYAERFNRRIAYALEQRKASGLEHRPNRSRCDRIFLEEEGFVVPSLHRYVKEFNREKAEKALELYEKSQVSEFEIVQVFYSHGAKIAHPEPKKAKQVWSHVSFTAKPKNVECSGGGGDASPKHFFGELLRDDLSQEFNAMYCSTFEPSHDPDFNHGCVFCPSDEKFHPANEYSVGRPPWYLPTPLCI